METIFKSKAIHPRDAGDFLPLYRFTRFHKSGAKWNVYQVFGVINRMKPNRLLCFFLFSIVTLLAACSYKSPFAIEHVPGVVTPEPNITVGPFRTEEIQLTSTQSEMGNESSRLASTTTANISTSRAIEANIPTELDGTAIHAGRAGDPLGFIDQGVRLELKDVAYFPDATEITISVFLTGEIETSRDLFTNVDYASLKDQAGNEYSQIAGFNNELGELELIFDPLHEEAQELSLEVFLEIGGFLAQQPLEVDVSGRRPGESWKIEQELHFGEIAVPLHTARLSTYQRQTENGATKQLELHILADNVQVNGLKMTCLELSPLIIPARGGCEQGWDGISASVSIGAERKLEETLVIPDHTLKLEARGSFILEQPVKLNWQVDARAFVTETPWPEIITTGETSCKEIRVRIISEVESANVRKGAGTNYEVIGELPPGQEVSILEISQNGEWLKIPFGDTTAWIYSGLVYVDGEFGETFGEVGEGLYNIPEGTTIDHEKNLAAIRKFMKHPELQLLFIRLIQHPEQIEDQGGLYIDCSGGQYWVALLTQRVEKWIFGSPISTGKTE